MPDTPDRKTVYDLQSIIERCFEEAKKLGYVRTIDKESIPPVDVIHNQEELVKHIALTVIGELYEFEIIRRIGPLFRENRALSHDFLIFGEAFDLFFDKAVQDAKLHGLRIEPQGD